MAPRNDTFLKRNVFLYEKGGNYMFEFMTIRELYELMHASRMEIDSIEYVQLQGWIRTNRCSGKLGFIELNDGTYFRNAQLVYTQD